ncbi:hypothetical protein V2G26_017207 [Clonostachys chloroleuca]
MSLEKLSPEVLQLILRFAHPSAHFSFALTSKTLYENSLNILERHRAANTKYAITSDIKPLDTIPELLRSAYGSGADGIEAWHVRELEIWRERSSWGSGRNAILARKERSLLREILPSRRPFH